jgi:integrase
VQRLHGELCPPGWQGQRPNPKRNQFPYPSRAWLGGSGQADPLARRRKPRDFLLKRTDGKAWHSSDQQRPLARACKAARLLPLTFHELRHTYASRLVMHGAPLPVVARQLGHSDTRMVEKHYGHMAPSYVADTVRAAFGPLGFAPDKNIVELAKPKQNSAG